MQISMEILSQAAQRTNSGTGVRQSQETSRRIAPRADRTFGDTMVKAMEKIEPKTGKTTEYRRLDAETAKSEAAPQKPETETAKPDAQPADTTADNGVERPPAKQSKSVDDTEETENTEETEDSADINEALAAGVIVNQNMVVVILEGDKESDTTPELDCQPAAAAPTADTAVNEADKDTVKAPPQEAEAPERTDINQIIGGAQPKPEANEAKPAPGPEYGTKPEAEPAAQFASKQADEDNTVRKGKVPIGAEYAAVTTEKAEAPREKAVTAAPAKDGESTGEVLARTPEVRTSEQQGSTEDNESGFSDEGDLSPLENENDKVPSKGQKGKTYSETADAVRARADNVHGPVNNTAVPLADGIRPEKFQADQQIKQMTMSAPVKAENLFEEMVARIETMQTEKTSSMTIQLKPEFLGKVALEVAVDAAGLHVKINAADSDVRGMINGQINTLIESLQNKGIAVAEVEVAYTGVNNGAFKDSREGQAQQSDRGKKPYRGTEPADSVSYYTALPYEMLDYYLDEGVSSVEYRA